MNICPIHPEVAQMIQGMKSGHLPADPLDIIALQPRDCHTPAVNDESLVHPEYRQYCDYARLHGYTAKC